MKLTGNLKFKFKEGISEEEVAINGEKKIQ